MKKILALFAVLFVCAQISFAQQATEVVYLKNGSVIKGVIIEQVPGVSLKVQTSDGSVFAYSMSEVEKITKEQPQQGQQGTYNTNSSHAKSGSGIEKGTAGFIDAGVGFGDATNLGLSLIVGYQFNKYFFAGVGATAQYYTDGEAFAVPIFADFRGDFIDGPISPFIDFRIGYTVCDVEGLYISPSVGCRFKSFNISVGYASQKYDSYWGSDTFGGCIVRLGFNF